MTLSKLAPTSLAYYDNYLHIVCFHKQKELNRILH